MNLENTFTQKISIIIPCRNEEKYIKNCLLSVIENDYPHDLVEVFVIDGNSDDKTLEIIHEISAKFPFIKLLHNPEQTVPYALNRAIKAASGDFVIRLDAHSVYPNNYFSELLKYQKQTNADNIGGVWITKPANNSLVSQSIAIGSSSIFGVGNAQYRIPNKSSEPIQVDTVPYGCYKKEVFENIGLFEPVLTRNQDDEFNARLIKNGGKIYLVPSIKIIYFARENLKKMSKMFYQYGLFKPLVNKKVGSPATARQFVPLLFVMFLLAAPFFIILNKITAILTLLGLSLYVVLNFLFSFKTATDEKNLKLSLILPIVFFIIHFSYGLGYILGIFKFIIFQQEKTNIKTSR